MAILDLLFYGFLICLGVGICLNSIELGYGDLGRPGSGFLPFWCGLLISLISTGILIQTISKGYKKGISKGQAFEDVDPRKPVIILGSMVLYGFSLDILGFILCNFFFLALLIRFVWNKKLAFCIIAAVSIDSAFFIIFDILLEVRIPMGILPGSLFG